MTDVPLDRPEFERWRTEADHTLASARREADADVNNWACFLAEQAAQLALKGLLHGLGQAPRGHDLARLGKAATDGGLPVPSDVHEALTRLGRHYIPPRYPGAHASGPPGEHYTPADSAAAIADAEAVVSFVDATWTELSG